jgi:N4-gp56 family major capsid protein
MTVLDRISIVELNLRLFDEDTQTTLLNVTGNDISPEIKTFYWKTLLYSATPKLVYNRFGQKANIPSGRGKTVEFRKVTPLAKALTKLDEGVTPTGNVLDYTTITETVDQYGDFTKLSDVLMTVAIDNQVVVATKRHGDQAGRTLDTVTREVVCAGSNRIFAPKVVSGSETDVLLRADITAGCYLTPDVLNHACAKLERENVAMIDGAYACIIHTDIVRDLMRDEGWIDAHKYADPEAIFMGEVGMLGGVRFFKTTEAKIIGPADMLGIPGYNRTTLSAAVSNSTDLKPNDVFTVEQATAVNARISAGTTYKLYVDEVERTVASVTGGAVGTCKITLTEAVTEAQNDPVCGTGAGKDGTAVYCTMLIGADAYGVTEIEGLGLEHIIHQKGSAGSADPLNQRATVGWKATAAAVRLREQNMIRIEHTSKKFAQQAVSN